MLGMTGIAGICWNWLEWLEMSGILEMAENFWKQQEMARNSWKVQEWLEMANIKLIF